MNNKQKSKISLQEAYPKVAEQWDHAKNDDKTPDQFLPGSNKYAWWICDKGHTYRAKICHRTLSGSRCPHCYGKKLSVERSLAYKRPDLAKEFHLEKNAPLDPTQLHASSRKEVWWFCSNDPTHEWLSTVDNRNKGNGCPYCINRGGKVGKGKSLGDLHKDISAEWDYEKNKMTPYEVAPFSNEKVWWICAKDKEHRWQTTICHRVGGTGCPYCAGQKVSPARSLAKTHPEIAAEWHPTKNGDLSASDISAGSNIKIWWQCSKDSRHEWKTACYNRTIGQRGCPYCNQGWTKATICLFVKSVLPILHELEPVELYKIMQQNGLIDAGMSASNSNAKIIEKITQLPSLSREEAMQNLTQLIAEQRGLDNTVLETDQQVLLQNVETSIDDQKLPEIKISDPFIALDKIPELVPNADESLIEFLIAKAVSKQWKQVFCLPLEQQENAALCVKSNDGNTYSDIAKERFSYQCHGAIGLELPSGYSFNKGGKVIQPNLMQRLVASRIKNECSLGNWSGTGAGKTLAAILASRVINARLTLIVTLNSTLEGWHDEIKNAYPKSQVFLKKLSHQLNVSNDPSYLILNYEALQQKDSIDYVHWLVDNHIIDFVVLDEIQNAKKRGSDATKRRMILEHLLTRARLKNNSLCVLGISATPVINSLDEAISLLNMIKGDCFELKTFPSLSNCIAIHEKMIINGVRYVPDYEIAIESVKPAVSGEFLLPKLITVKKNEILKLEQILLEAKLPAINQCLRPGTIVYTYYVDGLVEEIKNHLKSRGFSYAEFTGDNKEGLKLFRDKRVDILIASSTVGTGLDGLQYVCDQLVILSLPWTNAAYEQLLGRIYRQGSVFSKIRVVIPQVILLHEGKEWSWDKYRMSKIENKKTLGDAVLDGVIPDDKILSHKAMLEESRKSLQQWIQRLEEIK